MYLSAVPVIHSVIILERAFSSLSTAENDCLRMVLKSSHVPRFPMLMVCCQKLTFQCFAVSSLIKNRAKIIFL